MTKGNTSASLLAEIARLRNRLTEAEETLHAISSGEVDALVLSTNRKQTVQLIGAGDRVYRQFLEKRTEGTATMSADGVIRSCNASMAEMLQRPVGEVLGSRIVDHLMKEDREAFDSILADADKESYLLVVRLKRADGVAVPVYASATLLQSSEAKPGYCLLFRDQREVISTESTLRESEELYRELLDVAPAGIAVLFEGKIVFINPAGAHLIGADSEHQLVGKSIEEIVPSDRREFAERRMAMMLSGERKFDSVEDTLLRLDGTSIDANILASPIKYEGKIAIQLIFTDITERKREKAELEFRNILLSTQQEVSRDGILVVDQNSRILTYNRKFIEMWGIPESLVDGTSEKPVLSFVLNQFTDGGVFLERVQFLYEHPGETSHDELLLKDGRVIDRYSAPMVGLDGNYLGRVWYFRDITERTLANAERERLMSAIEQVVETVIVTDPQGNIQYVNPAFETMTGYTRAEVVGQNASMFKCGEQNQEFYEELWATISSGRTWMGRLVYRGRDDKTHTVEATISPVRDRSGTIANYVEVDHDMSAQRLIEARLRQAEKMETVGQLAGGVAHDFNNMLQVIITYTDMALSMEEVGERLRKYLIEIRRAAQRSAEITGQLLAFARKEIISPKIVDINDSVAGAQKMIQRLIGESIDVAWMPGHDLWKLKIDPTQLDQILANLAVNARDAIAGVGKLTIGTQNVALDNTFCAEKPGLAPGEYLLLSVSDDGCGMDKETLSHLFEPFFTTKEAGKGTGLGLATVYGIVKQNNGYISVYSEPGDGSTFKVYLPRAEEAAGENAVDLEPEFSKGGTETVLVVEDEAAILELTRESLEQLGYTVLTAGSPEEAIRSSEEHAGPIHLLITDVVMPQMNGRQLSVRLIASRPQLKCLYMSGYTADVMGHRRILDEGMKFIAKPFSLTVLAEKVREVLDG